MTPARFTRALFHLLAAHAHAMHGSQRSRNLVRDAWARLDAMIAMQKTAA